MRPIHARREVETRAALDFTFAYCDAIGKGENALDETLALVALLASAADVPPRVELSAQAQRIHDELQPAWAVASAILTVSEQIALVGKLIHDLGGNLVRAERNPEPDDGSDEAEEE